MRQVDVVGIRLELPSNQPVLILRDQESPRYLPLWIGVAEATAITLAIDGVAPSRPLTHDLIQNLIIHLDERVISVVIGELVEGTYYATINFANHDAISARPSDAVALAVRAGVPVFVDNDVMDFAGMDLAEGEDNVTDSQEELEAFRAFLDEIQPDDFS
ncbi:MAG: bifunctional nuclease family protein [Actinomycetes bacterium]